MFFRLVAKSRSLSKISETLKCRTIQRPLFMQTQRILRLNSPSVTFINRKEFSTGSSLRSFVEAEPSVDPITYEKVCTETLESLSDYFEEIVESADNLPDSDVSYGDGVLTVKLGKEFGTYVINRQSPNKQIWLSSPTSGPKRYDFYASEDGSSGKWIYRHNGEVMHELLQEEIKKIIKNSNIDFHQLPYGS